MLLPSMTSIDNAILVHGFDDDTKEGELIEFYYKLVYGGGTRNIYDGKVKSCQIFSIPVTQHENKEYFSGDLTIEHRFAIITFADSNLSYKAVNNQFNRQFKNRSLVAESCHSESLVMKKILETFSDKKGPQSL